MTNIQDFIENKCTKGSVYDLDCINMLLKKLGSPHKGMRIIHIAGTNGKGSISRMLLSVLTKAGYRTGCFNSPFLVKRNEYLCIDGNDCSDEEYQRIGLEVTEAVSDLIRTDKSFRMPTEFELSFAMAMTFFCESKCDIAIVECGLGGLSDATNVFDKTLLDVITRIGLDHIKLLGNTVEDIAIQKCGIIRHGADVVAYPSERRALSVIKKECNDKSAKLCISKYRQLKLFDHLSLKGEFQKRNACTVYDCIKVLKKKGLNITRKDIALGLSNTFWPGRYETLSSFPLVIADGGHNPQCVKALCDCLDADGIKEAVFVIGIMADKNYHEIFDMLAPYAKFIFATAPDNPRRLDPDMIIKEFSSRSVEGKAVLSPSDAVKAALKLSTSAKYDNIPVIITGSLYMMGEICKCFPGSFINKNGG